MLFPGHIPYKYARRQGIGRAMNNSLFVMTNNVVLEGPGALNSS